MQLDELIDSMCVGKLDMLSTPLPQNEVLFLGTHHLKACNLSVGALGRQRSDKRAILLRKPMCCGLVEQVRVEVQIAV